MTLPLLERIPIEIWEKILYHATRSPLLPFTEDGKLTPDLVDNLLLFDAYCETYDTYRIRTQAVIERLRLVCRVWAKLLQAKTNEFLLTDWNGHYYPSLRGTNSTKVGYCMDWRCMCQMEGCIYRTPKKDGATLVDSSWKRFSENQDSRAFHERFPRLRILAWATGRELSPNVLGTLTSLRALSIVAVKGILVSPAAELSLHLGHLTHLDLSPFPISSGLPYESFILSGIQYLRISVHDPYGWLKREAMGQWSFPSLRTLNIEGKVDAKIEGRMVHEFVMRHVEQLTALSLVYIRETTLRYTSAQAPAGIWDRVYPNLEVLGVDIQDLYEGNTGWVRRRARDDWQVRTMVINTLEYSPIDGTPKTSRLIRELGKMWGVKTFVLGGCWQKLKPYLYNGKGRRFDPTRDPIADMTRSIQYIVEMLEAEGMVMVDPFEVTLQEAYSYLVDPSGNVPAPI
ncbi:hypothetical protein CPB86DRAFT_878450 [Serendipita vermifera]|nr:hypothetical protein CPB86DRAFT_878450 [Serendipita vermifera]